MHVRMYVCMYICMYACIGVTIENALFQVQVQMYTSVMLRNALLGSLLLLPVYNRLSTECYQLGSTCEPTLVCTFQCYPAEEHRKPL